MKDMNEKNIKLEEEFKKLKFEMWKEAKKILMIGIRKLLLLMVTIYKKVEETQLFLIDLS